MQPGKSSDDIHTILSRFNNWSGKQNGDTVQVLDDEVREIPYDEAMRRVRSRIRAGNITTLSATPAERVTSTAAVAAPPQPAASGNATARPVVAGVAEPVRAAVKNVEALLEAARVKPVRTKKAAQPAVKKAVAHAALHARPRAVTAITEMLAKESRSKAKTAPVRKKHKAAQPPATKTAAQKPEEFRQVLAKSLRRGRSAARSARPGPVERKDCVSVPLSSGEKVRLRQCAAMAGVTVPVYLRMRALGMDVPRVEPRVSASKTSTVAEQGVPMVENQPHSGFGDWITLLRNRFLASPARFAERA